MNAKTKKAAIAHLLNTCTTPELREMALAYEVDDARLAARYFLALGLVNAGVVVKIAR